MYSEVSGPVYFGQGGSQSAAGPAAAFALNPRVEEPLLPPDMYEAMSRFKDFVKGFSKADNSNNVVHIYWEQFVANCSHKKWVLEVVLQDFFSGEVPVAEHIQIATAIRTKPLKYLPAFEAALQDLYSEVIQQKRLVREAGGEGDGEDGENDGQQRGRPDPHSLSTKVPSFQLIISDRISPVTIRDLKPSTSLERVVSVRGIVVQATLLEHKAYRIKLRCKKCGGSKVLEMTKGSRSRAVVPRTCDNESRAGPEEMKCGLDPYVIITEECNYYDTQTLKLQELPEDVPTGEDLASTFLLYLCFSVR